MSSPAAEFRVISNLPAVQLLADDWHKLWHADPTATVFQRFEWVFTWLDVYSEHVDEIFLIACYHEGTLVGLCPFYLRYHKALGFRQKQLLFVGTGEPERIEVAAEYMNLLCIPAQQAVCLGLIARALEARGDVGAVVLVDLVEASAEPLMSALTSRFPRCERGPAGFNYAVPVSSERLPNTFSAAVRKSASSKYNRLLRLKGFRVVLADDLALTARLFETMVELHNRRWRKKGKPGAFAEDTFCRFHRRLIELLLPLDAVLLFGLEVDGAIMAVHYCLLSPHCCHYYQSGIDEEFRPNVSPGLMCHVIAHQECSKRGIARYDLMKGLEGDYKAGLAERQNQLVGFRGFRGRGEALKYTFSSLARRAVSVGACSR